MKKNFAILIILLLYLACLSQCKSNNKVDILNNKLELNKIFSAYCNKITSCVDNSFYEDNKKFIDLKCFSHCASCDICELSIEDSIDNVFTEKVEGFKKVEGVGFYTYKYKNFKIGLFVVGGKVRENSLDFIAYVYEGTLSIKILRNYQYSQQVDNLSNLKKMKEHHSNIEETINTMKAIIDKIQG